MSLLRKHSNATKALILQLTNLVELKSICEPSAGLLRQNVAYRRANSGAILAAMTMTNATPSGMARAKNAVSKRLLHCGVSRRAALTNVRSMTTIVKIGAIIVVFGTVDKIFTAAIISVENTTQHGHLDT
ncbi:MAG: hypothetical protein WCE82_09050 [Halobacteriota archaeon]